MKLFEVTPITRDQLIPKKGSTKVGDLVKGKEAFDAGAFATVYSDTGEPGTVRKVVQTGSKHPKEDPYFRFIQMITRNQRFSGNPYLPKIYDVQVRRTDKGAGLNEYVYYVDMERLHPLDTLSEEEANMIGEQIIDNWNAWANQRFDPGRDKRDPGNPLTRKQRRGGKMYHGPEKYKTALFSFFKNLHMRKPYPPVNPVSGEKVPSTFRNIDKITDSNLKQALLFIREIMRTDSSIFNDMHAGNIMVRRGRGIPQLVITDPVA